MTTTDANDAAKKKLADDRAVREKAQAEQNEKMAKSKPTPTQEENDRAAMGEHIAEHEADGSPPDPHAQPADAKPGGTRSPPQPHQAQPHRTGHPRGE